MRSLFACLSFVIALLGSTQNADARYLMEMGGYNFHPYAHGTWQSQPPSSGFIGRQIQLSGQRLNWNQVADDGYADGYNLYQYVQGNPVVLRDPSGLWTAAECVKRLEICESGARDAYKACVDDGYRWPICEAAYATRMTGCAAVYSACMAGSEEGLKCIGTACVVTGAAALSQCDSPVPGPCDAAAAGIIGWWMCTPEDDPGPHPQVR